MKKIACSLLFLAALVLASTPALAHYPWLTLSSYDLKPGQKIKVMIGWGHRFPVEDLLKASEISGVTIYDPQGKAIAAPAINEFMFQGPALSQPGVYLVTAAKKPGFYTKLAKGFSRKPKTGLQGVKSCTHSLAFLKAVVNLGQGGGEVSRVVGQELELVPLKNPAMLKVGDYLPIRVLFQGKPVQGYPLVLATYAGFPSSLAYAHASHAGGDGVAKLRILHPGLWLVYVNLKKHYPNPKECDQTSYTSVLTFQID